MLPATFARHGELSLFRTPVPSVELLLGNRSTKVLFERFGRPSTLVPDPRLSDSAAGFSLAVGCKTALVSG